MAQQGLIKYGLIFFCVMSVVSFVMFSYMTNKADEKTLDKVLKFDNKHSDQKLHPKSRIFSENGALVKGILKNSQKHVKDLLKNNSTKNIVPHDAPDLREFNATTKKQKASNTTSSLIDYAVHIFYYPWYKNEKVDGKYEHWNHELLPHWSDKTRSRKRQHKPPGDIGANFYPELGPYSSADPEVIKKHMKQISEAGVGVVCVSWYPPQHEKSSETPVDSLIPKYLDAAVMYGVKIALHIEPFADRSGKTLKEVLQYAIAKYGNHPAFYRTLHKGKLLPLVYVYDSYQIDAKVWAQALKPNGSVTIRGTDHDAVVIALMVEKTHMDHIVASGFDGFYTYFASNGFAYACTWKNWPVIAKLAKEHGLIFIPSIGPGYIDTEVRPWNTKNTKRRIRGRYYKEAFKSALYVKPEFLSITSYNEWHEGTQIEPAVPLTYDGYKYEDYKPEKPDYYMNMTRQFVQQFHGNRTKAFLPHTHEDI